MSGDCENCGDHSLECVCNDKCKEIKKHKDLKPCVNCGDPCQIYEVQLGDTFTLTYLRVCSEKCMFFLAWEFLYELGEHKTFRGRLYDLQNKEDSELLEMHQKEWSRAFSENLRTHLKENKYLLSNPNPFFIHNVFSKDTSVPENTTTMRFIRYTKEERIGCQRKYIEDQKIILQEAEKELEELLLERE